MSDTFKPQGLIGRQAELEQICAILAADQDLMLTGVTGSGRRSLIRYAAQQIGARVLEIDCLRATTSSRFLELLAQGMPHIFATPEERTLIEQWASAYPLQLEQATAHQARFVWQVSLNDEWQILQALLKLPQVIAEQLSGRVVFVFQNFPIFVLGIGQVDGNPICDRKFNSKIGSAMLSWQQHQKAGWKGARFK
jgi:midasin (ATPase involved in ribosome maturation)